MSAIFMIAARLVVCYEYFVDADAVHVDDLEVETVPAELLPRGGNVFQLVENQSADRIVGIAGNGVLLAEKRPGNRKTDTARR